MKILHISTSAAAGGAGIAACRLHKGLRSLGAESAMLVNRDGGKDSFIYAPDNTLDKIMARVCQVMDRVPGRLAGNRGDRISASWVPNRLVSRVNARQPDILNLHWVNDGFMRIEALRRFGRPIVWTFHDMWPVAGGEHYVGEDRRYKEGYKASNRPAGETGLDVNRWIWNRKRKAWSGLEQLVVASPSRWLAGCVRDSALFRDCRVEVLPNGVDQQRFRPMDHGVVRRILGLPEDKKLILFGAVSATSDRRKGYHLLVDTLKHLQGRTHRDDYALVVFGASGGADLQAMETHYIGSLHDEISMALVYAAADVFLAPSLEDNLPNTVLESLACGTPVVAFDIGGMPDMVRQRENGYLARAFDTEELAQGLHWVLDDSTRWESLSANARETVLDGFTLEQAAGRYLDLYTELLGNRQGI